MSSFITLSGDQGHKELKNGFNGLPFTFFLWGSVKACSELGYVRPHRRTLYRKLPKEGGFKDGCLTKECLTERGPIEGGLTEGGLKKGRQTEGCLMEGYANMQKKPQCRWGTFCCSCQQRELSPCSSDAWKIDR